MDVDRPRQYKMNPGTVAPRLLPPPMGTRYLLTSITYLRVYGVVRIVVSCGNVKQEVLVLHARVEDSGQCKLPLHTHSIRGPTLDSTGLMCFGSFCTKAVCTRLRITMYHRCSSESYNLRKNYTSFNCPPMLLIRSFIYVCFACATKLGASENFQHPITLSAFVVFLSIADYP